MHLALLGSIRVEPEKGLEGVVCPVCKQPVYAKCGDERIAHWAHKSVIDCDPWKESETLWHRDWKNLFGDFQEQMHEKGGTRHMADVKTPDGTIVEFRHRFVNNEGQRTRQAFFGETMFWVVDCASNPKHVERLKDNWCFLDRERVSGHEVWITREAGKCFPRTWIKCRRFVFFDFGESDLWCIFPRKEDDPTAICMKISKDDFVAVVKDGYTKFRERCVNIYREVKRPMMPTFKPRHAAVPIVVQHADQVPASEPVQDIWPTEFDKTVSLAFTVDLVKGWLIGKGVITSLETDSCVKGDANATGCCVVHCSTCCSTQELYWAKRRIERVYGENVLKGLPRDIELRGRAGAFIGTVEYHAKDCLNDKVKLNLRNFNLLASDVTHQASRECIWRLEPTLQAQILS